MAACLTDRGKLFHNIGAAIINARSPIVFLVLIVLLANRIPLLLRRKLYLDICKISIKSERYLGASPLIALKVISEILNSMHARTGNQCNSLKCLCNEIFDLYFFFCSATTSCAKQFTKDGIQIE